MYTKNDPLYAKKRCHISHTKIALNKQNNTYITFKTFYKIKQGFERNNKIKLTNSNKMLSFNNINNLPKIESTDYMDNLTLTDEAKKDLYNKLEFNNKFKAHTHRQYSPLSQYPSTILTNNNNDDSKYNVLITNIPSQRNYNNNVNCSSLRKQNLSIYDDVNKMREKHSIIKKVNQHVKPLKLFPIDLFCCSKEKWDKQLSKRFNDGKHNNKSVRCSIKMMDKIKGDVNECGNMNLECKNIYDEIMKFKSDTSRSYKCIKKGKKAVNGGSHSQNEHRKSKVSKLY